MQLSPLLPTAAPGGLAPGWTAADTPEEGTAFGAELLRASLLQEADGAGLTSSRETTLSQRVDGTAAGNGAPGEDLPWDANTLLSGSDLASAAGAWVQATAAARAAPGDVAVGRTVPLRPDSGPSAALSSPQTPMLEDTALGSALKAASPSVVGAAPAAEEPPALPATPTPGRKPQASPLAPQPDPSAAGSLGAAATAAKTETGLARALDRAAPRASERTDAGLQRAISRSAASSSEASRLARGRTQPERELPEAAERGEELQPLGRHSPDSPAAATFAEPALPATALAAQTAAQLPAPTAPGASAVPASATARSSGQAWPLGIAARASAAKAGPGTGAGMTLAGSPIGAASPASTEPNRPVARTAVAGGESAYSASAARAAARTQAAGQDNTAMQAAATGAPAAQASGAQAASVAADKPASAVAPATQTMQTAQVAQTPQAAQMTEMAQTAEMAQKAQTTQTTQTAQEAQTASALQPRNVAGTATGAAGTATAAAGGGKAAASRTEMPASSAYRGSSAADALAGRPSETAATSARHASEQAVAMPAAAAAQPQPALPAPPALPTLPAAGAVPAGLPAVDTPRSATAEAVLAARWDSPEAVPALGRQITFFAREGIEHARIQLNPQDLGPIQVQLALDGTQVRLDLAAEMASTRALLEQSLPSLASSLREGGFTLSGGGVFQEPRRGEASADGAGSGGRGQPGGNGQAGAGSAENAEGSGRSRSSTARRSAGLVDVFA